MFNTPSPAGFNSTLLTTGKKVKHGWLVKAWVFSSLSPTLWNICLLFSMGKATFVIPGELFTTKQSQLSQHKTKTLEGTTKRDNSRTDCFSGGKLYHLGMHLPVSVCFSDEFGPKNLFRWVKTCSWLTLGNVHDGKDAKETSEGIRRVEGTWKPDPLTQNSAGDGPTFW